MRRALRAFLVRRAVEPVVVAQVVLAADEAFVNALAHGGGDVVRVSARVTQAEAAVEVRDRGAGFSPPASRIAAPDVDSPHGRGLFLMERLMDGAHLLRTGRHDRPHGPTAGALQGRQRPLDALDGHGGTLCGGPGAA